MRSPSASATIRGMEDSICPHHDPSLEVLRAWAWERGRTDIVLDLDLHDSAWAFQNAPTRVNLVKLAATLPAGQLSGAMEERIRRVADTGTSPEETAALRLELRAWSEHLCLRVAADHSEMTHEPGQVRPR